MEICNEFRAVHWDSDDRLAAQSVAAMGLDPSAIDVAIDQPIVSVEMR
jgi:hypothetical protein